MALVCVICMVLRLGSWEGITVQEFVCLGLSHWHQTESKGGDDLVLILLMYELINKCKN